jgi:hypothetical protein
MPQPAAEARASRPAAEAAEGGAIGHQTLPRPALSHGEASARGRRSLAPTASCRSTATPRSA